MSIAATVRRLLRGRAAEEHGAKVDREISAYKAIQRQNVQALQSGSRVMSNMAGMIRTVTEADRGGYH